MRKGKIYKQCQFCGKGFITRECKVREGKGKFCSQQCGVNNRKVDRSCVCTECGTEFYKDRVSYNSDAVFCSRKCVGKHMSRLYTGSTNIPGRPKSGVRSECDNCHIEIYLELKQKDKHQYHFCGTDCQWEFMRGDKNHMVRKTTYHDVECGVCGKELRIIDSVFKSGRGGYCSRECQFKAQETSILVECETCGEGFLKFKSAIDRTSGTFCSKECYGVFLRGEFYDPEDNRKRSEGRKWRSRVLKRDNHTCQCCGETEDELHAHHLKGYASNIDFRLDISNGITLCRECHEGFHLEFGKLEFTTEDYYEWIKIKKAC